MKTGNVYKIVMSAMLCGIGIVIPIFMPLRFVMEPASYTLGSHVAIFIAMFISPVVAAAVSLGTTLGFFFGGFPIVVVLRAASHVVFAVAGALVLKKWPGTLSKLPSICLFSLCIALLHSIGELIVVAAFYFGNAVTEIWYSQGFAVSVLLLVGLGTVIHSIIDFALALVIWKPIVKVI